LSSTVLGIEFAKTILQILVIIFAGQILSLIIAKFNRNRQESIVLNDYRKSFLDKINRAFVNSQKARRKLRIEGIVISQEEIPNDSRKVKIITLIEQMESINEIEFELRAMVNELRTFQHVFSKPEELEKNFKGMQEILEKLLKEFEHNLPKHHDQTTTISLSGLSNLADLIGPYSDSTLAKEYAKKFYFILDSIRKDILEARNY